MIRTIAILLALTLTASAGPGRPNVLVILTDDLGYSDVGCYGSEIETPTLDRLASNGLRFSRFYNTAKCHSSRVSLLTGRWCRQAGDEPMSRAVTIPEILRPAGYFTAMTGKWHLSKEPTDFGFERFFGHLSGATHFFKGDKTFRLNGKPWDVPAEGFYTTTANVDFALDFLSEARKAEKPWFLYIAFNAPHAPIHPLRQDYEKYRGRYTDGWDEMHKRRTARLRELGLLPEGSAPAPRPDHIPEWSGLSAGIRDWESRRMAGYAGMIDRVDQELARLVADLEKAGELDNTLILFFSDNGACPYDRDNIRRDLPPYDPASRWTDSTGWAWARNAPFRFYKQNQYEGGIATPAIVHWPAGLKAKPGSIVTTPAHLVDVLPTLLDLTGAENPGTFPGREPTPLAGISLAPAFAGKPAGKRPPIHFLHDLDRALRDGDWKIVSFRSGPWELYNLTDDPTELHDLAAEHPQRVETMAAEWHRMAREVLMATPREQQPVSPTPRPKAHPEWSDYSGKRGDNTSRRSPRSGRIGEGNQPE
jgi:arylsulfatase A-like enzyme